MSDELRPYWRKLFNFNWKFGLFLLLLICIPRFAYVLHANETANYSFIGIIMLVSALIPFVFLSRRGRRKIGLRIPKYTHWIITALLLGLAFALALYALGDSLYGSSYQNWFVYIGKSYNIPIEIESNSKFIFFLIVALTSMTVSPIVEELYFRGIVHSSFSESIGEVKGFIGR